MNSKWQMPEITEWAKEMNAHKPTLEYGREIYEVVKAQGYKNALEIGCEWGVSTLAILMAGAGNLTSVDVSPVTHAPEEVEVNNFKERWAFVNQDSHDYWKSNNEKFDLIYVDGSHKWPQCYEDMMEAWERLSEGGLLICDDFTHKCNMAIDTDGTVEYGVSFAVCNLICEKRIKKIDATTRLFMAYK